MAERHVRAARVYDEPTPDDGSRILVDRLWPGGIRKTDLRFDEWCKDVAPSTELRHWYGHDPDRFAEFTERYRFELTDPERAPALAHLHELARARSLTLLTASKAVEISHAAVLARLLTAP